MSELERRMKAAIRARADRLERVGEHAKAARLRAAAARPCSGEPPVLYQPDLLEMVRPQLPDLLRQEADDAA